jgi:putative ABC transport system permease protein
MEEHLANSLSRPKFMSTLTASFGALALMLSVIGIYGVMTYSVTQRTRELAVRIALGADRRDVMGLVLSKTLRLAIAGVVVGVLAAVGLTRVLSGQLFGVEATDPVTFGAGAILLVVVALLAGAVPALKATRIDGARVLR